MLKWISLLTTAALLTACKADMTHQQLANAFADVLNGSGQVTVTFVKSKSLHDNLIVIQNKNTREALAVTIDRYQSNSDAWAYFQSNQVQMYRDLEIQPTFSPARYHDRITNLTFETAAANSQNLEKMAALKEGAEVGSIIERLQAGYGLSRERSSEIARLVIAWKKAGGRELTDADHDSFAKQVLGVTITEAKIILQSQDQAALDGLFKKAADLNGTTIDNVRELFNKFAN